MFSWKLDQNRWNPRTVDPIVFTGISRTCPLIRVVGNHRHCHKLCRWCLYTKLKHWNTSKNSAVDTNVNLMHSANVCRICRSVSKASDPSAAILSSPARVFFCDAAQTWKSRFHVVSRKNTSKRSTSITSLQIDNFVSSIERTWRPIYSLRHSADSRVWKLQIYGLRYKDAIEDDTYLNNTM